MRIVPDTNLFLSSLFSSSSPPAEVLKLCVTRFVGLRSGETLTELTDKLASPKFVSRFPEENLRAVERICAVLFERIEVTTTVTDCRDGKDDKFLALAIDGRADVIVTGDQDLLVLHPWRGIPILSPRDFLDTLL